MNATINPFKFQTAKIFDKSKNGRDVHADECPIAGTNVHLNKKIIKFGTVFTDDIPFKTKRSESMIIQSSSFLDMYTDIQAKKQTKILSRVKSAKDIIIKLFKTNGRVSPVYQLGGDTKGRGPARSDTTETRATALSRLLDATGRASSMRYTMCSDSGISHPGPLPLLLLDLPRRSPTGRPPPPAISNLGALAIPYIQHRCVRNGYLSSPLLTSVSQSAIPRVRVVTVFNLPSSGQTRLKAVTSLVTYSEHVVEEHVEDFVSSSRSVAEVPSPSSPPQLLTASEPQRTPRSTFLFNELYTIEEEVGNPEMDAEEVHLKPKIHTVSSSCGCLTTSDSEAKYDAMLAAEFATFSFDSDDIQEWSNEVERGKQAEMDVHFAYVSEALAVPVPKLSAYFINDPSPVKTEISETNTSSADSSLVTSVDAEESRPQFSPTILRGLRRVRSHEDLKNLQVLTDCNDSFSDLSCWSFDLSLSDSPAAGSKTGALRRSVKCNDLRRSFLSLESGRYHTPSRETTTSMNRLSSSWNLGDPILPVLLPILKEYIFSCDSDI